ncbi:MAG: nucleotide disphospho-sugar-binding domain-containing protein [Baekduia sp.]
MRAFLAAFGDAGHVFPILALGRALADRGAEVTVETYTRWQDDVEREGHRFVAAPEFAPRQSPDGGSWFLPPFAAAREAVPHTREALREHRPDVVVSDILTVAPALAAELEGIATATLIPHIDPRPHRDHPPYSLGAMYPRTAAGKAWWARFHPLVVRGGEIGRDELNGVRERVGLPPQQQIHNGISSRLAIVASFPQLEYPREQWEPNTHVVGPLMWEPQTDPAPLPGGDPSWPLVLVAPSTAQDPDARLLQAAAGLAELPIRLLITTNRRPPKHGLSIDVPNVRVVDWLSYAQTMPHADVVVCHGGFGTLTRALACGAVPVIWPAWGDMAENAARAAWAGAAVRVPRRFLTEGTLRLAVQRALDEPELRARARELAAWNDSHDAPGDAARLVEDLAAS